MGETFYETLGLQQNASVDDIRDAYLQLVKKYHPDKNNDANAYEFFIKIQIAYNTLSDPDKRNLYDKTIINNKEKSPSVKISFQTSRSVIPRLNETQIVYALVEINSVPKTEDIPVPLVHICIVLDRSTSMKGNRMDMVKQSLIKLINSLQPSDVFSVVTFNDNADIIITPSSVESLGKIELRFNKIKIEGGTEIFKGLKAGMDLLWTGPRNCFSKHIILITDGLTYGDESTCIELMEKARAEKIVVNTLGIGSDWNDDFLDKLANLTGGNSSFISNTNDIDLFMNSFTKSIKTTYARGLTLTIENGIESIPQNIFRMKPDFAQLDLNNPVFLGDLYLNKMSSYLLTCQIPPLEKNSKVVHLINGKLGMEIYSTISENVKLQVDLNLLVTEEKVHEQIPIDIINALSKISLYQIHEKSKQDVINGNYDNAVKKLGYIASRLTKTGNIQLATIALSEAETIKSTHRYSADGDKRLKYGTKALLQLPKPRMRNQ
jgi:Ca-activated chloride channel family protein